MESVATLELVGESNFSAEEVFSAERQKRDDDVLDQGGELEHAMSFILEALTAVEAGAMPTRRLYADAADHGIAKRTMERARAALGCRKIPPAKVERELAPDVLAAVPEEDRRGWWIGLPETPNEPPEEWAA